MLLPTVLEKLIRLLAILGIHTYIAVILKYPSSWFHVPLAHPLDWIPPNSLAEFTPPHARSTAVKHKPALAWYLIKAGLTPWHHNITVRLLWQGLKKIPTPNTSSVFEEKRVQEQRVLKDNKGRQERLCTSWTDKQRWGEWERDERLIGVARYFWELLFQSFTQVHHQNLVKIYMSFLTEEVWEERSPGAFSVVRRETTQESKEMLRLI